MEKIVCVRSSKMQLPSVMWCLCVMRLHEALSPCCSHYMYDWCDIQCHVIDAEVTADAYFLYVHNSQADDAGKRAAQTRLIAQACTL